MQPDRIRRKESVMKKITVRMKIDKWRRKRELKKLMKKLEAGFPDMDEKLPDEEMPDFCSSFEGEEESVYELAATVASFTAERAADHFTDVVDGMRMDTITEMLRMIRHGNPESGLRMLKGMFYARCMKHAAEELDIIVICEEYCEDIYDWFIDDFMQTEEIDWFLMKESHREVS